jgi:hypothetical protein
LSQSSSFTGAKRLTTLFVVAYAYPGSTDVKCWLFFADLVDRGAIDELYASENPLWNHPEPMTLFLQLVLGLVRLGLPFSFALKLLPVLANVGIVALVLALGRRFLTPAWSFARAASYALSPAAIAISAYHGNTDSLMVFGSFRPSPSSRIIPLAPHSCSAAPSERSTRHFSCFRFSSSAAGNSGTW